MNNSEKWRQEKVEEKVQGEQQRPLGRQAEQGGASQPQAWEGGRLGPQRGRGQGGAAGRGSRAALNSHVDSRANQHTKPKTGQAASLAGEVGNPLPGAGLAAHSRTVGKRGDELTWPSTAHWHPGWRKERGSPRLLSVPFLTRASVPTKG